MTQALYLKWRPQRFEDVIGQEHIINTLRNSLRQDRIRHAYLFSGPRGTGKTTTARLLAKAVNCLDESIENRPCGVCANCVAVAEGRLFDLIEIDAASHTGVDDVRDLRDKIAFSPSDGRFKVYIIDEVHRFSGAAFDALLKTLEEPPKHAIFVLATTELDKVPATIKSRCLLFEFRRVSLRQVIERLELICEDEGIRVEPAALELVARQGTGSVRDSISLLDQILADPSQEITFDLAQRMLGAVGSRAVYGLIEALFAADAAQALDVLHETLDRGADPRQFGQQLVEYLRQVLLVQISGVGVVDASDEMRHTLQTLGGRVNRRQLIRILKTFTDTLSELKGGWQPQLGLELAILEAIEELTATPPAAAPHATPAAPPRTSSNPTSAGQATATSNPAGGLSLGQAETLWRQVVMIPEVQQLIGSSYLRDVKPIEAQADYLVLHVPPMLSSRLKQAEAQSLLGQAVEQVFGRPMQVHINKRKTEGPGEATSSESIRSALFSED